MKHIKKSSIYLGTLFLFCCLAAFGLTPNKGNAENISVEAQSISWEITEDGVLRISGEGIIPNDFHPWEEDRANLQKITGIIFDEGITGIGSYVIRNLSNVSNISFPSTLKEIGANNFFGINKLQALVFPNALERIGYSFINCQSLKQIAFPENIKSIDGFVNCDSLKEIYIPASAEHVWDLTKNSSLEKIEVDPRNKSYVSEDGILFEINSHDKGDRTLRVYPAGRPDEKYIVPDNVTGVYGFSEAINLKEVVLPEGVVSIGEFDNCKNLERINIPSTVRWISTYTFSGCMSLKNITILSGVEDIGEYAFEKCPIKSVIIPDSVTYIGSHAFDASTIICCTKDSAAEKYAKYNGHNILYIDNHSHVYESPDSEKQLKQWEKASAEFLEFIIKHINDDKSTFTHFVGIMVDGEHVSPDNYTAEPGSLILRLKASYLETLSPGEHTLKAIFDDGDIEIPFLVDTEKAIDYTKFDDVAVPTDTFTFKKVWQGDHEDSIDFTLYQADGSVYHHGFDKRVVSKTEWRYNAYFSAPATCYVIEKPVPGYQIKYVNVGVYADITDRCCDGGTIINKKIPKTGDAADFALWAGIIALGVVGLTTTIILTKRKKAHK